MTLAQLAEHFDVHRTRSRHGRRCFRMGLPMFSGWQRRRRTSTATIDVKSLMQFRGSAQQSRPAERKAMIDARTTFR